MVAVAAVGVGIACHVGRSQGYSQAARVALDDPATLDPCSTVTADAFAGPGITVHIQPFDLATCSIATMADRSNASGLIRVSLRHVDTATLDRNKYTFGTSGPLHLAEPSRATTGSCTGFVYQDDGAGAAITAMSTGLDRQTGEKRYPSFDACAEFDKAVTAITAAVTRGTLTHLTYPADSIGSTDPCSLLTGDGIDNALQLNGIRPGSGTAAHVCAWRTGTTPEAAKVVLTNTLVTPHEWNFLWNQDRSSGPLAQTRSVIAGHDTRTQPTVQDRVCVLDTMAKTWQPWPGRQVFTDLSSDAADENDWTTAAAPALIEQLELRVVLPATPAASPGRACRAAQALAALAWPHLPADPAPRPPVVPRTDYGTVIAALPAPLRAAATCKPASTDNTLAECEIPSANQKFSKFFNELGGSFTAHIEREPGDYRDFLLHDEGGTVLEDDSRVATMQGTDQPQLSEMVVADGLTLSVADFNTVADLQAFRAAAGLS